VNPLPIIDRAVNNRLWSTLMGAVQHISGSDAVTSLLGWWRDAGVDCAVSEGTAHWLGQAVTAASPKASPETAGLSAPLPQSLDALIVWLTTSDIVEAGPPRRRLLPAGDATSDLMILADFPDLADIDSEQHLSGPLSDLFDKMLGALGRTRDSIYIATLCPGRPVSGRLSEESVAELAMIAKHHVSLIAPKYLWLMGGAASRAILRVDDAAAKGKLHNVNLNGANVNVIATAHPRFFEGSKARKAAAWAEMQRLMTGDRM
jgi:uracil-DNA glycosylase